MAKEASNFPSGATDGAVLAWMHRVGIDPNLVHGYTLERGNRASWITLKVWFEDAPRGASVDAAESVSETIPFDDPLRVRDRNGYVWVRGVALEYTPESVEEGSTYPTFSCLAELASARGPLSYA